MPLIGRVGFDISDSIYLVHLAMSSRPLASLVGSSESHLSSSGSMPNLCLRCPVFVYIFFILLQTAVCRYINFVMLGLAGGNVVTYPWYF